MKCLCCGKPLSERASETEKESRWHTACVKRFFGTKMLPDIAVDETRLTGLALESTGRGFTVPGVQKKISLHLTTERGKPRLTLVNYPNGYILKPRTETYDALPESEYLVMSMAAETGIETVPFALIKTGRDGEELAYITKRIDREWFSGPGADQDVSMYAMEDFCQLDQKLTEDKYRGSYERCAGIIRRYSIRPGLDLSELFLRVVFSFVTGNSDMHLKNFSLKELTPAGQDYVLSAAYDMLPVNVIVPEDDEEMALTLHGKKRNLHRNDFLRFAENAGIVRAAAIRMTDRVLSMRTRYMELCEESLLPARMKERFQVLMEERMRRLES